MSAAARNFVVWVGVALVVAAVWFFGARPRLHFIDPGSFLLLMVAAAAAEGRPEDFRESIYREPQARCDPDTT